MQLVVKLQGIFQKYQLKPSQPHSTQKPEEPHEDTDKAVKTLFAQIF